MFSRSSLSIEQYRQAPLLRSTCPLISGNGRRPRLRHSRSKSALNSEPPLNGGEGRVVLERLALLAVALRQAWAQLATGSQAVNWGLSAGQGKGPNPSPLHRHGPE